MSETALNTDLIETKLASARTRLILDKPFLGALVLRLPMVAANNSWCSTTATDAKTFYYNPEYIDSLTLSQTQFMLAHEALHCALSHFARRQHRIKHRWDLACDYAINPLLIEDGLIPPPDTVIFHQYKGMTAEEIYPLLDENDDSETLDEHVYDQDEQEGGAKNNPPPKNIPPENTGNKDNESDSEPEQQNAQKPEHDPQSQQSATPKPGDGNQSEQNDGAQSPPPLTPQERETLAVQWQQRMAGAAQQAMQSGKLDGSMARMIDHLLQPQLPWRMLLAHYMTSTARDDFSYMRPSRREGSAILPSLRSSQINICVAVDTSGSIKNDEIGEFLSEIDALKAQIRARITLLPCDAEIAKDAPFIFEPWDEIDPPEIQGGGGTNFIPVFDWLSSQDTYPDLLVYFTDAEGKFPEYQPPYPVTWLVKGKAKTPWGRRIQLN